MVGSMTVGVLAVVTPTLWVPALAMAGVGSYFAVRWLRRGVQQGNVRPRRLPDGRSASQLHYACPQGGAHLLAPTVEAGESRSVCVKCHHQGGLSFTLLPQR